MGKRSYNVGTILPGASMVWSREQALLPNMLQAPLKETPGKTVEEPGLSAAGRRLCGSDDSVSQTVPWFNKRVKRSHLFIPIGIITASCNPVWKPNKNPFSSAT